MAEALYQVDEKALNALASNPSTLRRCFIKFVERLIRHVLWARNNEVLLKLFKHDKSFVITLYRESTGNAICLILSLIDKDIAELYEDIKENLKMLKNLKAFISRLAENLVGRSPRHLLLFLAIVISIFTKTKEDPYYTMETFIETVAEVLVDNKAKILEMGGFEAMDEAVDEILKNPVGLNDLCGIKFSNASDYF